MPARVTDLPQGHTLLYRALLLCSVMVALSSHSVATSFAQTPADTGTPSRAIAQVMASGGTVTSMASAEGLTLKISAACSLSGSLCPFRAEVHAAPVLARRIQRVEYTYYPDRRTAPSANTNSAANFRFDGSQYTGELVYAEVSLAKPASGAAKSVRLQTTVPFSALVRPALPAGLRFEDKYQMEFLEGTPTDYYQFRVRLRGKPEALKRVMWVDYHLPDQYFSRTEIRALPDTEYYLEAGTSNRNKFDIVAVIRWINGTISTYRIPFRPP